MTRTHPDGVPCRVDVEQPDLPACAAFYGGRFGWTVTEVVPGAHLIAHLDGADVAALAG